MDWWNVADQLRNRFPDSSIPPSDFPGDENTIQQVLCDLGFWEGLALARVQDSAHTLLVLHEVCQIVSARAENAQSPLMKSMLRVKLQRIFTPTCFILGDLDH